MRTNYFVAGDHLPLRFVAASPAGMQLTSDLAVEDWPVSLVTCHL